MGIYDLFSKRQKRSRGETPDVYTYDQMPRDLRVQIVHILNGTLGNHNHYKAQGPYDNYRYPQVRKGYDSIHGILCREYGKFSFGDGHSSIYEQLIQYFLNETDVEKVIDFIELSFKHVDILVRQYDYWESHDRDKCVDDAIQELNDRFKEHGIGYEYKNGEIIRIDSQFIHSNAVQPVLVLLAKKEYEVANNEYMTAHEHYRHKRNKDAITWALKSFESTMKVICAKREWAYDQTDPAKKLIEICFQNELIPKYLQSHFSSLQNMLTCGIPTIRNRMGGHGDGPEPIKVPQYLVEYCLHITASTLLFMIEAEENIGK